MASLGTVFSVEVAKLVRRPMTWILAAILLGFVVLIYGAVALALLAPSTNGGVVVQTGGGQTLRDSIRLPEGLTMGLSVVQGVGGVLLAIVAAGSFGSEFGWGTLRTMLVMRAERTRLAAAKLLTLTLGAVLLAVLSLLVGLSGAVLLNAVAGDAGPTSAWLTAGFAGQAAFMTLRAFVAIELWMLASAALTVATRSVAAGVGITLALFFVGDLALQAVAAAGRVGVWISRLFLNTGLAQLGRLNTFQTVHLSGTDYAWMTANLAAYAVACVAVTVVLLRRMNVLGSSSG